MIGQDNLRRSLEHLVTQDSLPRFLIFVGEEGSGKRTLYKHLMGFYHNANDVLVGTGIDDVRSVINSAYKVKNKTFYFIPEADNMSNAAKNALLKLVEEPPNNVYIVMTLLDKYNTLETIRSRACIFDMENYTASQLTEFYDSIEGDPAQRDCVADVCSTPGDVLYLNDVGIYDFYEFVEKVVNHISEASVINTFKIAINIAFSGEPDKYNLKLFWKILQSVCITYSVDYADTDLEQSLRYAELAYITNKYLRKLKTRGINKMMLFDRWLLEVKY